MNGMNIPADGSDSDDSYSTHAPTTPAHSISPNPSLDSEEDTYRSEASTQSLSSLEVSDSSNQTDLRDDDSISSSAMPILVEIEEPNLTHLASDNSTQKRNRTGETWMTTVITTWLQ
jgi:hypothetical protein